MTLGGVIGAAGGPIRPQDGTLMRETTLLVLALVRVEADASPNASDLPGPIVRPVRNADTLRLISLSPLSPTIPGFLNLGRPSIRVRCRRGIRPGTFVLELSTWGDGLRAGSQGIVHVRANMCDF